MAGSFSVVGTTYGQINGRNIYNQSGTVRIAFSHRAYNSGTTVYSKVYINGIARGTERSTTSTTLIRYTEDFTVNAGDRIDIYAHSSNSNYCTVADITVTCANAYAYMA